MKQTAEKKLIAFFSHTGENYCNGKIIDLEKGNTHIAAEMIAAITDAELYEIKTVQAYPYEYTLCTEKAKEELKNNEKPELGGDIDISEYEVIYLGFPNWWGTMPMPVWTFLENHDFSGKTIFPFCTHEGSRMGSSETDLKKLAKGAKVGKGLAIHGSFVKDAEDAIREWIKKD